MLQFVEVPTEVFRDIASDFVQRLAGPLRISLGLHINGRARILTNEELPDNLDVTPDLIAATEITGGRHPECWILVEVEEACIHCSKHVLLFKQLDKAIAWGTDDETLKGGDFFRAKISSRAVGESGARPYDEE